MVEFNPDGSIKLTGQIARNYTENAERLKKQKCIKIAKDLVSESAPKKCILKITVSDMITDTRFIENILKQMRENFATPIKINKTDEKNFEIEIGTNFKRCSECTSLVGQYREFLGGNIIIEKGRCTFEGRSYGFSYEDYFD